MKTVYVSSEPAWKYQSDADTQITNTGVELHEIFLCSRKYDVFALYFKGRLHGKQIPAIIPVKLLQPFLLLLIRLDQRERLISENPFIEF